MTEKILIIGAGGHAKSVADALLALGRYEIVGVTSPQDEGQDWYCGIPWAGTDDGVAAIADAGCRLAAMGIGFMGGTSRLRDNLALRYKALGFEFPPICDPSAVVAAGAVIADGAFVGKGTIVNADARVGRMAIVNSGALVEHECLVGDYSHIAVSAVLCGQVTVADHVLVGANATVLQCLHVASDSIVGAGCTVLNDVPAGVVAVGVYKGET